MRHLLRLNRSIIFLRSGKFNSNVTIPRCLHFSSKTPDSPITETLVNFPNQLQRISNVRYFSLSPNVFAKDKNRGKEKKKKGASVVHIDENEMSELVDVGKLKLQMNKSIEMLKSDFIKNLNVRSSIGSIEDLPVQLDGKDYVLQDLAQIARKAKMVVINAEIFPQATPYIIKALNESGMNLNPQQDGTKIFVATPKVTKEHREMLSKNAKVLLEKCKVHLRDVQNTHLKKIQEKQGLDVELSRRVQAQIRAMCQKFTSEAETITVTKQQELLGTE